MDLEGIRFLIHVAELGSVQGAAERLAIPRSSLRRRLDNLEAEIGRPLLVKSASGIELTPAGTVVLEEGRALLEQHSRMLASAQSVKADVTGRVVLVVPVGLPLLGRLGALEALHAIAAGLAVEERLRVEPLDHLHEPFDLMFHFGDPPPRGAWFSRIVGRVRLAPVCSQAYLDRHGRPTSIADLEKHRILGWRRGKSPSNEWPLRRGGVVNVTPVLESNDGEILHRAARDGQGILLGNADPNVDAAFHGPVTPLLTVLEDEIGTEGVLRCLSPHPADASPRTRAVLQGVHAFMDGMADLS